MLQHPPFELWYGLGWWRWLWTLLGTPAAILERCSVNISLNCFGILVCVCERRSSGVTRVGLLRFKLHQPCPQAPPAKAASPLSPSLLTNAGNSGAWSERWEGFSTDCPQASSAWKASGQSLEALPAAPPKFPEPLNLRLFRIFLAMEFIWLGDHSQFKLGQL